MSDPLPINAWERAHFETAAQGWAVRTAEPIRSGTFVCEYIGEVLNDREANQRGVRLEALFFFFFFFFNSIYNLSVFCFPKELSLIGHQVAVCNIIYAFSDI